MRILSLRGSPRQSGSSNLLTDSFLRGAKEAGHETESVYLSKVHIHPCTGCKQCQFSGFPCSLHDDMEGIRQNILNADMLVFATPLYYFGMSAQLKTCLDRCCAINKQITEKHMKSVLIVSAWNDDSWTMDAIESHYKTLCRYMNLEDKGMILGTGCGTPDATKASKFPLLAYQLGKQL